MEKGKKEGKDLTANIAACLLLTSDETAFITGQVLQVDGGLVMPS